MSTSIVTSEIAEPYAQALLSLAQSNGSVEPVAQSTAELLELLKQSDELSAFLGNPLIEGETKKGVLQQVLGENPNPNLKNFLLLLVDRGRISLLTPILKQFQALVRELNQTVLAEITSAVELTEQQRETIRRKVKSLTSAQQVELETRIDPDLLGGVIIQVGSQVIDASLRGQLRRIGVQLSATAR
ncbi:F0F1 ATP synthase subunit delta [Romeria aff. gracilis LEGE 07310]|uniref:ATP synthase subunit delta n=1 Tax=Vasconcelosia minhoensis LEGE 07310 TaxID=915328 RepID=A0A8J7A6A8_9CYAN|nr:ATP synthase F1 subunit delta [Romeria gracilis]MBE9077462.1 F0F1 ATP synthase subunit delta [Romeria aff. gracilis LEGE 07310]